MVGWSQEAGRAWELKLRVRGNPNLEEAVAAERSLAGAR